MLILKKMTIDSVLARRRRIILAITEEIVLMMVYLTVEAVRYISYLLLVIEKFADPLLAD